jgi:hypothetical protein
MVVPVLGVSLGFCAAFAFLRGGENICLAVCHQIDLGVIEAGAVFERKIVLRNSSDKPIRLEDVSTSCGCTTTTPVSVIAPRSTVPLTVRYDSAGRDGDIKQSVSIRSGENTLVVPIIGKVVRSYKVSASEVRLKPGKPSSFTVSRRDGKPINAPRVQTPQGVAATVSVLTTNALLVSLRRDFSSGTNTVGQFQEPVRLIFGGDRPATLTATATWTIASRYRASPELINFGSIKPGATVSQTVTLSGAGVSRFKVSSVPPGIYATLAPRGTNQAMLTLFGKVTVPVLHDEITITTGDATEPRLHLPIVATLDTTSGEEACSAP